MDRAGKEQELWEKSFQRPKYYFLLSYQDQWKIDKELGLLDWEGHELTKEEKERFNKYFIFNE